MSKIRFLMVRGALAFGALAANACGGPDCDRTVSPGADDRTTVQAMFEEAQAGETLCFSPGTYRFDDGVAIAALDGITILGTGDAREDVILDFYEMGVGNSGLSASSMTNFRIEHLQVIDASQNDIFVTDSSDVTFRDVSAGWVRHLADTAGKYAIYPVQSSRVLIEDSEAFGSSDAGIYVGQTTDCIVRNNIAHGNVAGIEIENSISCEVYGNDAYDNTAGILVFELPGIPQHGGGTLVHDNIARENNRVNFARDGIVMEVPTGIGIMILAANQVEVRDNTITANQSSGIVVVSYRTALALGVPEPTDPTYDGFVDDIWLHDNTFTGNGLEPWEPLFVIPATAMPPQMNLEDILWDGFVDTDPMPLCIDETGTYRWASVSEAMTFEMQGTDRTMPNVTCEGTAVPPVVL